MQRTAWIHEILTKLITDKNLHSQSSLKNIHLKWELRKRETFINLFPIRKFSEKPELTKHVRELLIGHISGSSPTASANLTGETKKKQ
jgi:hypothetical protein